jgi:hypothetical protein
MFEIIISVTAALFLISFAVYGMVREKTIASAAFSFLSLLLMSIVVIDCLLLNSSIDAIALNRAVIYLESILPAAFLLFSFTFARKWSGKLIPLIWKIFFGAALIFPVSVFLFPIDSFFYSPDLQTDRVLFLGTVGYWFYMGAMIYCVLSLMNLEATFSSTFGSDRWKIKFEVIGMSSIISVLIFYFSQGLLYRTINMNLIPIRSGVFIVGSLLIGYSKLFRGNHVRIVVSRFILYRSLTLVTVGLYLLVLGMIGEGMRYLDITFSRDLTIFVAFASGIAVVLIFLSERIRRKTKVFVNKHFYPHKYDYRSEWLRFTERLALSKTIAETKDAILNTYGETFGLRGVSLYLLNRENKRYFLSANHALPNGTLELSVTAPLIHYFGERKRVFNIFDNEYMPTGEEALFLQKTGARQIVPLIEGENIEGFVVFGEQLARENFNDEDYDLMKTFARQAMLYLMNMRLLNELAETREIAAVARITSFVIHDLKNHASTLSLLLVNAKEHIGNPEFQSDLIEAIQNTLKRMETLMQRLKSIPEKPMLNAELTDIHLFAQSVVDEIIRTKPDKEILYQGSPGHAIIDVEEMKKVLENLILNALDAIGEKGKVWVETGMNGKNVYVRVKDDGCGMIEDFMNSRLFKLFGTTKKKGLGIGLYQSKQIVESHSGMIDVQSELGRGATFTVFLPAAGGEQKLR